MRMRYARILKSTARASGKTHGAMVPKVSARLSICSIPKATWWSSKVRRKPERRPSGRPRLEHVPTNRNRIDGLAAQRHVPVLHHQLQTHRPFGQPAERFGDAIGEGPYGHVL